MSERPVIDTRFRTALARLDRAGRLVKVRRALDPVDEVAGVMRALDGDRALLFERVDPGTMPVLGNFLSSEANVEVAFGLDRTGLRRLLDGALATPIPPEVVARPPVQEHVHRGDFDLGAILPVLQHAPGDSGRFITAGVIIAREPETGVANASYHRLQLLGGSRTAIKLDQGRHLRRLWEQARARGEGLPISVAIGPDLSLLYAGAFMGAQMPFEVDELHAAGGLRGAPLPVASGLTQDVVVPAEAEIVLEGVISAEEVVHEGPFGEFLGYHSDDGAAPVVTFSALTHRADPVYVAISGAGRETVMLRKHVLEAAALRALRAAVPIVTDVNMTAGGLHRFHLVIAVAKRSAADEGFQRNAALAAFAALKDLDQVIVVDDDIDIHDARDVEYAVATRMHAERDLVVIPGARGHEYIRVSDGGVRAKLIVDATVPFAERDRFRRIEFATVPVDDVDLDPTPGSDVVPWLGE